VEIILILSDSGLLVPMKQSAVGALYGIRNIANLLYYSLGVLNVIHLKWIFYVCKHILAIAEFVCANTTAVVPKWLWEMKIFI